jgi:hypothetical protein
MINQIMQHGWTINGIKIKQLLYSLIHAHLMHLILEGLFLWRISFTNSNWSCWDICITPMHTAVMSCQSSAFVSCKYLAVIKLSNEIWYFFMFHFWQKSDSRKIAVDKRCTCTGVSNVPITLLGTRCTYAISCFKPGSHEP